MSVKDKNVRDLIDVGFNRTEDSLAQTPVFSLWWTWERRCEESAPGAVVM